MIQSQHLTNKQTNKQTKNIQIVRRFGSCISNFGTIYCIIGVSKGHNADISPSKFCRNPATFRDAKNLQELFSYYHHLRRGFYIQSSTSFEKMAEETLDHEMFPFYYRSDLSKV